jgi:small subunit ribosomal protein S21
MTEVRLNRVEKEMLKSGNERGAFESMLSRFKHSVQEAGILRELKKHEFFEKPSVDRSRRKRNKLIRSRQQQEMDDALYKTGDKASFRPSDKQFNKISRGSRRS